MPKSLHSIAARIDRLSAQIGQGCAICRADAATPHIVWVDPDAPQTPVETPTTATCSRCGRTYNLNNVFVGWLESETPIEGRA